MSEIKTITINGVNITARGLVDLFYVLSDRCCYQIYSRFTEEEMLDAGISRTFVNKIHNIYDKIDDELAKWAHQLYKIKAKLQKSINTVLDEYNKYAYSPNEIKEYIDFWQSMYDFIETDTNDYYIIFKDKDDKLTYEPIKLSPAIGYSVAYDKATSKWTAVSEGEVLLHIDNTMYLSDVKPYVSNTSKGLFKPMYCYRKACGREVKRVPPFITNFIQIFDTVICDLSYIDELNNSEYETWAKCSDCDSIFRITGEDRAWFTEKGFALPKRCMACRRERKQKTKQKDSN